MIKVVARQSENRKALPFLVEDSVFLPALCPLSCVAACGKSLPSHPTGVMLGYVTCFGQWNGMHGGLKKL